MLIRVFYRDHASGERPERILDLHEQFRNEELKYSCSHQLFDIDQNSFKMVINFIQSNSSAGQKLSYFDLKRRLLKAVIFFEGVSDLDLVSIVKCKETNNKCCV